MSDETLTTELLASLRAGMDACAAPAGYKTLSQRKLKLCSGTVDFYSVARS